MVPILIIILLTLAQNGLMVSKLEQSFSSSTLINGSPQLSPFEMDVPDHFEALGNSLTVRVRLSLPTTFSNTTELEMLPTRDLYLQLGIFQNNGALAVLTQEKVKQPLSLNWESVSFECGWLVKGGKYFVLLTYYTKTSGTFMSNPPRSYFPPGRNLTRRDKQVSIDKESYWPEEYTLDPSGQARVRVLAKKTITVKYPTISFEVPTRLETYTTSAEITFGLTRTICKPKVELPSTVLTLTICARTGGSGESPTAPGPGEENQPNKGTQQNHQSGRKQHHHHRRYNPDHYSSSSQLSGAFARRGENITERNEQFMCQKDVSVVFQEPLKILQTEGRVKILVECQLWGRNATYTIQLRERSSGYVIAQSSFIRVEWSSQFLLRIQKSSVLRCEKWIPVNYDYPQCILPGRDKIRIYGHQTLPVPSLLAPSRVSYIGEQQVSPNKTQNFPCHLFPARFLRFCFQYVNTAVDDSVAVVTEKCIPTGPVKRISDGGWSPWSRWSSCSVTCGPGGKRFRYRFCDSPLPSSGADYCKGKSIQDEPCDPGVPCPTVPGRRQQQQPQQTGAGRRKGSTTTSNDYSSLSETGSVSSSGEIDTGESRKYHGSGGGGSGRPSFMDFSVLNVSTTPGCECGCILYDLVPTKNYSLVIIIAANQSSCADEDEQDHHNFRWILHAKNEKDRIRLDVVGMDVQCVTMTFRDGNTTDSNLLEVITASQPSDPIQFEGLYEKELGTRAGDNSPQYHQPHQALYQYDDDEFDEEETSEETEDESFTEQNDDDQDVIDSEMDTKGSVTILRIESTGPSLSIGTTTDSSKNCSGQFIYFIAYYTTITTPITGVAERKEELIETNYWTFFAIKIMVLVFVGIVVVSGVAGFLTKLCRKYRYKELKCFEPDDEEGSLADLGPGRKRGGRDTSDDISRCTSITLMSFDHSYWRRLRVLRLKYFLLRPRILDPVTTKTKSFPNTPTVPRKVKPASSSGPGGEAGKRCGGRQDNDKVTSARERASDNNPLVVNKPISLSESNLRDKSAVLAVTENGYELRQTRRKSGVVDEQPGDGEGREARISGKGALPRQGASEQDNTSEIYNDASLTSTSASISVSLNGSRSSGFSTPTPTPTQLVGKKEVKGSELSSGGGIKLLKEQENLKRRGDRVKTQEKLCGNSESRSSSETSYQHKVALKKRQMLKDKRILNRGDSTASVSTVQSLHVSQDSSRVASRADLEDTDQDFEMDYYDYDVMNAGNIPGSYLGLEPAFVLWNSEVADYSQSDEEEKEVQLGECENISRASSRKGTCSEMKNLMEDSAYGIEMMSSGSSMGMFSQSGSSLQQESGIKETSLDTLKFADDDDEDLHLPERYSERADTLPGKGKKETGLDGSQLKYKYKV